MINPKRSDAHMRIAHTVFEALYRADIERIDCQVFCLLLRRSWGFQKKTISIYSEEIAEELGKGARFIRTAIQRLVKYNMLEIVTPANKWNPGTYKPNKLFESWDTPSPSSVDRIDPERTSVSGSNRSGYVSRSIRRDVEIDPVTTKTEGDFSHTATGPTGKRSEALKETYKETYKETPLPPDQNRKPMGGLGVVENDRRKTAITALKKQFAKNFGSIPPQRLVERAWELLSRDSPPGWDAKAWREQVKSQFEAALGAVLQEAKAGKVGNVLGVTCTRFETALGLLAKQNPPKHPNEEQTLEDRNVVYTDD